MVVRIPPSGPDVPAPNATIESRIAIGTGRNLVLNPPQSGEPLNYFMYPYAEADGKPLNEDLFGFNLGYKITFREL